MSVTWSAASCPPAVPWLMIADGWYRSIASAVAAAAFSMPFSVFDTMTGAPPMVPRQNVQPAARSSTGESRAATSFRTSTSMAPCTTTGAGVDGRDALCAHAPAAARNSPTTASAKRLVTTGVRIMSKDGSMRPDCL